jgi:ParB family chromosome partitioning protein
MKATPKRVLGRGFEALLPTSFDKSLVMGEDERIQKLLITSVAPNPDQPRRHFDVAALEELSISIREHGIVLPLVVRPIKDGSYRIIAGERRWRAAGIAGLKHVPAIVRTLKELEELEIALVENVQRVDLAPLEQAASLRRLHDQFSTSYEDVAKRLGKGTSTIVNIVRLLNLPPDALKALAEREITEGHARTILSLKKDPSAQADLLNSIIKHGWNVRQAERYVSSLKDGVKEKSAVHERVNTETPATKALSKRISAPVNIHRTAHGGKLEIIFKTDDELERIIAAIN